MSLLERVERAQQGADSANGAAIVPVAPPPPKPPVPESRTPAREELLATIRVHLQAEVIGSFEFAARRRRPGEANKTDRGLVDRVIDATASRSPATSGCASSRRWSHEITGFGPLEPLLNDPTITEVMVNGPNHIYIERAGKIVRVDAFFLNDEHVLRIIDRIITPLGRRIDETSPRVDARLPDGSRVNAIIAPLSLIGPVITVRKFSQDAVHGRGPDRLRHGDAGDVRVPAGLHRGPAERLRVGRHGLRQDDVPQRPVVVHPERRADRDDRGRRRAPAPPGARHHARGAPAEPRGRGRDHDPRPAAQRDAHAPRPDHRRRVPLGRGARHAPGDDDRPGRLAVDRPREHARGTCSGASRRWS